MRSGGAIAVEVLINFAGPLIIYDLAKHDLGDARALMASSAPPIVWSLVEFWRKRRVDALSILVLTGIALSLIAFVGGGSIRWLQLREKLVTAAIGLIFLGSAAIGRPLIYQLARARIVRRDPSGLGSFEELRERPLFKRTMLIMTLVWGFGLVGEALVAGALVFAVSIQTYFILSPVIGYGTMGALGLWTFLYERRVRRIGAALQAQAAS